MASINEKIITSDINISNPSTRIPIVFVFENISNADSQMIKENINKLLDKIKTTPELKSGTEIGIIKYRTKVDEIRSLSEIKRDEIINISAEKADNEIFPNMGEALNRAIKTIRLRNLDYKGQGINSYPATIILFSSGDYSDDEKLEMAVEDIKSLDMQGKVKLIPFSMKECSILKSMSTNGNIYNFNSDGRYLDSVFDTIGKSIEKLSESSTNAYENITSSSISWDEFIKKGK